MWPEETHNWRKRHKTWFSSGIYHDNDNWPLHQKFCEVIFSCSKIVECWRMTWAVLGILRPEQGLQTTSGASLPSSHLPTFSSFFQNLDTHIENLVASMWDGKLFTTAWCRFPQPSESGVRGICKANQASVVAYKSLFTWSGILYKDY